MVNLALLEADKREVNLSAENYIDLLETQISELYQEMEKNYPNGPM